MMLDKKAPNKCELETLSRLAVEKFGNTNQLRQTQEECGELVAAINHYLRDNHEDTKLELINEVADVTIMLEQLKMILGEVNIQVALNVKLSKLKELINNA